MSKFNDLLNLRFKIKDTQQPKMSALVEKSSNGDLSSFSGVFRVGQLTDKEKEIIEQILKAHQSTESIDIDADLKALGSITSEVKAITNQAVILHGERIKRAQDVLKKYRDGAFTAWLYAVYGNRQTPYNFLQYYEFYIAMPTHLQSKIDQMPRQIVYSLASRQGDMQRKQDIIQNYNGQPKQEILQLIRIEFPLGEEDRRHPNYAAHAILQLKKAKDMIKNTLCVPSEQEKVQIENLLVQISALLSKR